MTRIMFVDTSVLVNFIPVPGRDQDRDEVQSEFQQLAASGATLLLPVTAVIECGNFVAQLNDGPTRRTTSERFCRLLSLIAGSKSPWLFNQVDWSEEFWLTLLHGASTGEELLELLTRRIGVGDLAIIAERDDYQVRSGLSNVEIWSLDAGLSSYS